MKQMTYRINPSNKVLLVIFLMMNIWGTIKPQSCETGCYHCETINETSNCLVCDFENSFILDQDGTSCTKREISGCQVVSSDGFLTSCLKCDAGKVFDQNANSCVSIPSSNQVNNCGEYESGSLSCLVCNSGYYLKEAECVSVPEDSIKNCSKFSGPYQCAECEEGFFLDKFSCLSIPEISGCKSYTFFHCEQCSLSSKFVPSYVEQLQFSSGLRDSLSLIKGQNASFSPNPISTPCLTTPVQNCSSYNELNICGSCSPGYHVDGSGNCKINPTPLIANCIVYEDAESCQKCSDEFYVGEGECEKRQNIVEKCVEYAFDRDICLKCEDDYFVTGELNICQKRIKSLDRTNCLSISATSDHCLECKEGFLRTNDLFNCFAEIGNCDDPETSDFEVGFHICNGCAQGYYPNENKNQCLEHSVNNCDEYEDDSGICKVCEDNFYFDSESNRCESRPNIQNCLNYVTNENKCEKCESTFYLNDTQTDCLLRSVDNCEQYEDNKNNCEKCDNLHYLVDSSTCSPITASNCMTSGGVDDDCTTCLNLFKRDSPTSCSAITATDCQESNGEDDDCTICLNLFKRDSATSCSAITATECQESNGEDDVCVTCNNLKYPDTDTSCSDITNLAGCQSSDGKTNNCKVCNTSFKLDAEGVCQSDATFTPQSGDSNCSEFALAGGNHCKKCNTNFDLVEIEDYLYTKEEMEEMSCSKIDTTNNLCKQCAPLSDSPSAGVCTPVSTPYNGSCYQLKENKTGNLDGTSECDSCVDSRTMSLIDDCGFNSTTEYEQNSILSGNPETSSCPENQHQRAVSFSPQVCSKKNILTPQSMVENCFLFNKFTNECQICDIQSARNDDNKCVNLNESTHYFRITQDSSFQFIRVEQNQSTKTNDESLVTMISRFGFFTPDIVKCTENSIKLIDYESKTFSSRRDDYINIGTPYKPYQTCVLYDNSTQSFLNNNEDFYKDLGQIENCHIVKGSSSSLNFFCAQCKEGYMGKVFRIYKDNTGVAMSPHKFGIYKCEKVDDLDFDVGGLDYNRNNIITNDRLTTYITAGKCLNSKHLIYFLNVDNKGDVTNVDFKVGDDADTAEKVLQYKCVDDLSNIDLSFKDNCQIFAYTPDQDIISEQTYQNIPAQYCLACKPGFKAVMNEKNHIIDCVEIEGCDTSNSDNNKMNACMTCVNKSWVFENGTVHFDKCAVESNNVSKPLVEGCLYHDDSLTTEKPCRFCDRGYDVTIQGDCKKMQGYDTCSNPSYGKFKNEGIWTENYFGTSLSDNVSLMYFFFKYRELMPVISTASCYDCNEDEILTVEMNNHHLECTEENYDINFLFSNCQNARMRSENNTCVVCKEGYVFYQKEFRCLKVPENIPHLAYLDKITDINYNISSDSCKNNFYSNSYKGICERDYCLLRKLDNACSLVEKGYYFHDELNEYIPSPNNETNYSPYYREEYTEIVCEGENMYMVLVKKSPSGFVLVCKEISLPQEILDRYQDEIIYFISENSDGNTKIKLKVAIDKNNENRLVNGSDSSFPALNWSGFCINSLPDLTIENCKTSKYGFCFECETDYELTGSNECSETLDFCDSYLSPGVCGKCSNLYVLNEISECVELSSNQVDNCQTHSKFQLECAECDSGYFLTKENQCQAYSVSCSEYSFFSDECVSCENNMYFVVGDIGECSNENKNNCNRCEYREFVNCRIYDLLHDRCSNCDLNTHHLLMHEKNCDKENNMCYTCELITEDANCLAKNLSDNSCQLCDSNYYLESNLNICQQYSAKNCEIYDPSEDKCLTCQEGLVKDDKSKNCQLSGHATCETLSDDKLSCETCPDGMVKDDRVGCIVQNVTNCTGSNLSPTENKCIACDDSSTHFLDYNNNCLANTSVDNCSSYAGNISDTKCEVCEDDFYLNKDDNTCLPRTADRDCKDPANQVVDKDECSSCDNVYFILKTKLKCEKNDCSSPSPCASPSEYMNQETCECTTRTNTSISGCNVYSNILDECSTCETTKFLENGLTCTDYTNAVDCSGNNISKTADECLECDNSMTHFFNKTTKLCEARTSVSDCEEYFSDKDECFICETGFFLAGPTTCTLRTNTSACAISNQIINADACFICDDGRIDSVLGSSGTSCTARANKSDGCYLYALDEDKCQVCLNNYTLNATSGLCEFDNKSEDCRGFYDNISQECRGCPPGFHVSNSGECLANNQPNCFSYFPNTNQCQICSLDTSYGIMNQNDCFADPASCQPCPTKTNNCLLTKDNSDGEKCFNCPENYYYDKDTMTCLEFTAENCLLKNSFRNECLLCKDGFLSFREENDCELTKSCLKCAEKKTVLEMVENCEEENSSQNDCEKCFDGFYMKSSTENCYSSVSNCNECVQRTITSCLGYDKFVDQCTSCNRNSHYLKKETGTCGPDNIASCQTCIEGTAQSCKTFRLDSDHCQTCIDGYFIDESTLECVQLDLPNCEIRTLDQKMCSKCKEKFYLNEEKKECVAVTEIENCESYKSVSDECSKCLDGYFYDLNMNKCRLYPNGPYKCIDFNPDLTCKKCDSGFFLSDEKICQEITTDPVSDCLYYSSDGICSTCNSNFWLNERTNQCIPVVAQNCLEVKDPYTCSSCDENYILETGDFHTNCIESGINNCSKAILNGTPICLECRPEYILSDDKKTCTEVENKIENCHLYESQELCKSCKSSFYLSSDKKSCLELSNQAGNNCAIAKMYASPVCDICERGYFKDLNGNCIKCIEGCNFCDYKSSTTCFECGSDYLINEDKKCVKKVTETEPNRPEQIQILKVSLMLILIVAALIKFE